MTNLTIRQRINAKCKDCIYDPLAGGTWTQQVENCKDTSCSLWEIRPLTSATKKKISQEKYDAMSPEEKEKADKKAEAARERFQKVMKQ